MDDEEYEAQIRAEFIFMLDKQEEELDKHKAIIKEVRELTEMLYKNEANIFYKGIYKKQLDILDKENK